MEGKGKRFLLCSPPLFLFFLGSRPTPQLTREETLATQAKIDIVLLIEDCCIHLPGIFISSVKNISNPFLLGSKFSFE